MMSEDKLKVVVKPPMGGLKKGISANRANYEKQIKEINPNEVPNRLGLVMDDSGSMGQEGMENAHSAVKNFTSSCNHLDTSIALYPLNAEKKALIVDFDVVNMYANGIWATGGTPIYSVLSNLITEQPITRAIVFSDGEPTDSHILKTECGYSWGDDGTIARKVIDMYIQKEISIDTIYIGEGESKELKELARVTGGTYINFKDTKSLSQGLKYLAPKYRALLSNPELKEKIERGEKI